MTQSPEALPLDDLIRRITAALARLHEMDHLLLQLEINERALTHRLGMYLQDQFPAWHVDCEYNRVGFEGMIKRLTNLATTTDDLSGKTIYPDIIIHHRGEQILAHNLVAIEVKRGANCDDNDLEKLQVYSRYYQYALFLRLAHEQPTEYSLYLGDNLMEPISLEDYMP